MDEVTKFLINIQDRLGRIEGDISAIKEDIKEHIRRTDQNESMIQENRRSIYLAQGGLALLFILSTLLTVLAHFHIIK